MYYFTANYSRKVISIVESVPDKVFPSDFGVAFVPSGMQGGRAINLQYGSKKTDPAFG